MVISPVLFPSCPFSPKQKYSGCLRDFFCFKRGSWALAYGIMAIARKRSKKTVRVLFPDYFCKEPLEIIQQFPVDIGFYPIQKNFEPDWEKLEKICDQQTPDALVLVHYFGFSNNLKAAKEFCDRWKIALIEDCAHVMPPYCLQGQSLGMIGDVAIWSPWKFFSLPDLGFLRAREDLQQFVETFKPHRNILLMVKWLIKRETQRMLCALGVNWYKWSHNSPQPPLNIRGGAESCVSPNKLSLRLFHRQDNQIDHICARRIENYKALVAFFKKKRPDMLFFDELPNSAAPYLFPCLTKEPAQNYVKKLVQRGVPAAQWPDLPDEVKQDKNKFFWAHFYAEHLILLPIHQNVSKKQIEYINKQIEEIC